MVVGGRRLHLCAAFPIPASQTPVYKNASLSKRFLLSDTPFSLRGYIQHCDKAVWPLFSHLEEAVQDGSNQHQRAFGRTSEDLFQVIIWPPSMKTVLKKKGSRSFLIATVLLLFSRMPCTTARRSS